MSALLRKQTGPAAGARVEAGRPAARTEDLAGCVRRGNRRLSPNAGASGFTLIEVLVAITILVVGMMAMAAMVTKLLASARSSKYMSQAATLATEKLEDLNRWDAEDPQVCVPTGQSTAGSLTADVVQTTTCDSGSSASVNYYDDISLSFVNDTNCPNGTEGCIAETVSSVAGGNTVYTTTYHSPDGTITTATSNNAPASATFHRRWIIEANQPTMGVRRITVLVTLQDATVHPSITFQMSMVRP